MALTDKLVQINKLKLQLDELQPMSLENEKKLWGKIRLEWNFNSNHIEGNTLTYGETQLLLMFDKTTGDHELREYDEMKAHDVAIHMVKEWAKDKSRDLTENDIRELNKIILVQAYWKDAITTDGQSTRRLIKVGEYKEYPNSVRQKNGEIFEYASPFETPHKMADLMQWYRNNDIQHPLVFASQFHYDFIRIHPFDDGNGRLARLLVNYVLMKHDYPPIVIRSSEKEKYLTALNKADVGDLNAFHEYMADQLISSLEMANKAAHGESIEDIDDVEKEVSLWKKQFTGKADVIPKSFEQIHNLYKNGFRELLVVFTEKMKQFEDLFNTTEVKGWGNGGNYENAGIESIDRSFVEWEKQFDGDRPQSMRPDEYKYILMDVEFKGFVKNGKNTFDQTCKLAIEFMPYHYQISVNDVQQRENLYSKYITAEDIKSIASFAVKDVFEKIKSKVQPNNP